MGLTQVVAGMVELPALAGLRSSYDFEAPGLTVRARIARLEYAAEQAYRQACDPCSRDELDFTLAECRALLEMESLEGEIGERERVQQRLERIRRVVCHHEGWLSRVNRRYWWIPFSTVLLLMGCCSIQSLSALWVP